MSSSSLRRTLLSQIADDDHAGVVQIATTLLQPSTQSAASASPVDVDVLMSLVVALLHEQRHEEVDRMAADERYLSAFTSSPSLAFCHAYALYKMKELQPCLSLLRSSPLLGGGGGASPPHVAHLQAQAEYKQGHFAQAVATYQNTFSSQELSSDVELSANLLSALISAQSLGEAAELVERWQVDSSSSASYELTYNAACVRMECGDWPGALQLVRRAQQLAQSTLTADGLSEAEVADETAVLRVQEGYLLQRMHQPDAALPLYLQVLQQHPSDAAVVSVASNNVISLRSGEQKVFDSLKRSSKAVQGHVDEEKLTSRQRLLLTFNRSLVLLSSKQLQPCHSQDFPSSELPILVEAALASAEKKPEEAESILQSFITAHPGTSAECQLALAHLSLVKGDVKRAISLVDSLQGDVVYLQSLPSFSSSLTVSAIRSSSSQASFLPTFRERPAVVAALAALYEQSGDEAAAVKEVDAVVERWAALVSAASAPPAVRSVYLQLLDSAAENAMSHQRFAAAARLIQRASAASSQSRGAAGKRHSSKAPSTMDERALENVAKLVLATAPVDLEAAQSQASLLPPVDLAGVNAEELNLKAADEPGKKRKAASTSADEGGVDSAAEGKRKEAAKVKKPKKKKARRVLYPKGFDPSKPNNPPPDPERWLPKWERTQLDHRGRKRKVQDGPMRGAQGGTSSSAGSWQPGSASSTSAPSPSSNSSPAAATSSPMSPSSSSATSEGVEQRADSARPSAAAAAAARKKKKPGKKMGF